MAVLRPLKVVIENYPEGESEEVEARQSPGQSRRGHAPRAVFGREIFIERDDFMENPPKKFFRLSPGTEVRLRYAYFITCREVVKNAAGEVIELRCTYDPATKGGNAPDGRKVKATMHWVSAADSRARRGAALQSAVHAGPIRTSAISPPRSIRIRSKSSPTRASNRRWPATNSQAAVQFERQGYFCPDPDSTPDRLVFNRTVGLRDTWAKVSAAVNRSVHSCAQPALATTHTPR